LHKNLEKKIKKRGISQYLDEDGNDDDIDSFDDGNDDIEGDKSMMAEKDPSKLLISNS